MRAKQTLEERKAVHKAATLRWRREHREQYLASRRAGAKEYARRRRLEHPDLERAADQRFKEKFPHYFRDAMQRWRDLHPEEARALSRKHQRAFRDRNPGYRWEYTLKYTHKMTTDEYWDLFKAQHGVCAICHQPARSGRLRVDHDHQTKRVRGLLCSPCNLVLGHGFDNPVTLRNGARYLKRALPSKLIVSTPPQLKLLA